ncbi:zinc finger protein 134 isoform X4 [Syngnathus scovelli]|uniref:zinc finger protein 134 isoform X4 n=1 Tax=Syngnathus scovelli TaxID=161590 RepID=UPI002110CB4C|nr:endothelial zinc finger protein induced by tumor necrosis factor alpha isoform X4 [Syngnathus scovelli]
MATDARMRSRSRFPSTSGWRSEIAEHENTLKVVKMLKEFVRKRLMVAADEIFELFESTIASYKEQLCHAREESERHRCQLEAVRPKTLLQGSTKMVSTYHLAIVRFGLCPSDQDPQSPLIKEEEEQVDVSNKPLTVISAKSEDDELCRRSRGAAAADNLLAPLSHSEDTEESSKSGTDCEGDDKRSIKEAPKRFVCSACGERFARKSNMVTHMRVHTGDKPFCCSVCGETFARKVSLKGHAATHTGEKPFTCSVCGERFAYNYNLTRHMHTHTGDKRFACSVCGKIFNQRANMVAHLRTHTGEKPFQCTLCGDRFAHRVSLIAHTATHTGQKPFLCPVCGEGFSYKYSLTAHMRKHRQ